MSTATDQSGKLLDTPTSSTRSFLNIYNRLSSQTLCGHGALVGVSNSYDKVLVIPMRCKSWDCPDCGPRKARLLAKKIVSGRPTKHITLTLRHDGWKDLHQRLNTFKKAFTELVRIIREPWRQDPSIKKRWKQEFEYALVYEIQGNGNLHMHICARSRYLSFAWLSKTWRTLTGSSHVFIKPVRDTDAQARHDVKYLLKHTNSTAPYLRGKRIYQFSNNYLPPGAQDRKLPEASDFKWSWCPRSPWTIVNALPSYLGHFNLHEHPDGTLIFERPCPLEQDAPLLIWIDDWLMPVPDNLKDLVLENKGLSDGDSDDPQRSNGQTPDFSSW